MEKMTRKGFSEKNGNIRLKITKMLGDLRLLNVELVLIVHKLEVVCLREL